MNKSTIKWIEDAYNNKLITLKEKEYLYYLLNIDRFKEIETIGGKKRISVIPYIVKYNGLYSIKNSNLQSIPIELSTYGHMNKINITNKYFLVRYHDFYKSVEVILLNTRIMNQLINKGIIYSTNNEPNLYQFIY